MKLRTTHPPRDIALIVLAAIVLLDMLGLGIYLFLLIYSAFGPVTINITF